MMFASISKIQLVQQVASMVEFVSSRFASHMAAKKAFGDKVSARWSEAHVIVEQHLPDLNLEWTKRPTFRGFFSKLVAAFFDEAVLTRLRKRYLKY